MSNQEKLKNYLLGKDDKDGYLKSEISNGKVIMLSGKWGSGKTHFWQNLIASDEFKKELKEKSQVYSYISLYGKSSIEEIENDIFSQAYYSAIGGENFVTKGFSTFTKRMSRFGSKKVASGLKGERRDSIERTALKRLENGGVICFDDFERKSKDIDLNDLFGFITQLTLKFKCKVVIILNDDVFEGEEKEIFSSVKEKTVSKYLKYEPSIRELFASIFFEKDDDKFKYSRLRKHVGVILKTFEEAKILNARIYMQVLDNLLEWIDNDNTEKNNDVIRYFIVANINFIERHKVFEINKIKNEENLVDLKNFYNPYYLYVSFNLNNNDKSFDSFLTSIKNKIYSSQENTNRGTKVPNIRKTFTEKEINDINNFININTTNLRSLYFGKRLLKDINIDNEQLEKINTFIETGILED